MSDITPCNDTAYWGAPPDVHEPDTCPECGEPITSCSCPCCQTCGELYADCRCPEVDEDEAEAKERNLAALEILVDDTQEAMARRRRKRAAVVVADEMYGGEDEQI